MNRTLGKDILPPLLVSFGLSVILQNGLLEVLTADSRKLRAGALETASFTAGGISVGYLPLLMFGTAVAVVAALLAVPVAALVFRLQGAYFAIGTWVVAEVFWLLAAQMTVLGGGPGVSLPTQVTGLLGRKAMREVSIFWVALALGAGGLGLVHGLLQSRIGRALTAIRDSWIASPSLGIRIARVKYAVYICVAAMTAMIGALVSLQKLRVSPDAAFNVKDWTAFVIFIQFIFDILGGIGPEVDNLVFMKRTADRLFGAEYRWSVWGAGAAQIGLATTGSQMGGSVRVGLEDSLQIARGKLASNNAEQVRKIRRIIEDLGCEVATPDEAREILDLKGADRVAF